MYSLDLKGCYDFSGASLWHEAAVYGHSHFISEFLVRELGIDHLLSVENCIDKARRHPLHTASRHGQLECVSTLLNLCSGNSEIINSQDIYGATPIHIAVLYNRSSVVKLLLQQPEIKLDVPMYDGLLPLDIAQKWGHLDCASLLLDIHKVSEL